MKEHVEVQSPKMFTRDTMVISRFTNHASKPSKKNTPLWSCVDITKDKNLLKEVFQTSLDKLCQI